MGDGPTELVFIGDDFTGASDTLATLSRGGWRARLFLGAPDIDSVRSEGLDAVGVATETRAVDVPTLRRRLDAIAPGLAAGRPRFVHYKVCSTFDSSPSTGSIGAAIDVLTAHFDPSLVAIVAGQPSLGRYCLFGHLFAAAADGVVYAIDRHPVMRSHPSTPMHEPDLRLHLAAQGLDRIGHVTWLDIGNDAAALARRVDATVTAGSHAVLFDVGSTAELATIGAAVRRLQSGDRPVLLVGASSVAESLTLSRVGRRPASPPPASPAAAAGRDPCFVVAGSRSSVTAGQVAAAQRFRKIPLTPDRLLDPEALAADCAAILRAGGNVLVHLVPEHDYGVAGIALAQGLAAVVAAVVERTPVPALGVAGGDTSSIVIQALGIESLAFHSDLDRGVALCTSRPRGPSRDGMRLMLKGGQMGAADLFDRFALAAG